MKKNRLFPVAATAAALTLTLSACSSSEAEEGSPDDGFETVKIEHALGTAEITEEPERIVTLGQGSAETAIALGETPVGIEEYPWGSDETGYLPWIHEAVKKSGDELPEQFTGGTEMDVEKILELDPDVILAPWSGITQEQYGVLSDIAPTVAYPEEPWSIEWDQQITTIGKALGQPKEADELIDGIKKQFAEAKREKYAGLTFSYIYNDGPGTLGVFYPEEQRVAMVSAFGLTPDPVIEDLRKEYNAPGTASALIGLENADKLNDSDLLFTFYSDPKNRKEIEDQELYAQMPAVQKGAMVAPTDPSFVTGSSIINPLTVPWTLERYGPLIDEAVKNLRK